jgi:hypothetical protein
MQITASYLILTNQLIFDLFSRFSPLLPKFPLISKKFTPLRLRCFEANAWRMTITSLSTVTACNNRKAFSLSIFGHIVHLCISLYKSFIIQVILSDSTRETSSSLRSFLVQWISLMLFNFNI